MPNLRIIADNAADRATLSASSTAGSLAVDNLKTDRKGAPWRALSTSARLGATWTTSALIGGMFLPFCNLSPTATVRTRVSNEAPATNLFKYGERFAKADWTKSVATVVPDAGVAPDGSLTADRLVPSAAVSGHSVSQSMGTLSVGDVKTSSFFAKRDTGAQFIRIAYSSAVFAGGSAYFNLATGAVTNIGAGSVATMDLVAGGWWRCRLTATATGAGASSAIFYSYEALGAGGAGDGVSGPLIWGAMVTDGPELTSYYPSLDTFTSRNSVGTYIDAAGVLQTAAVNVARTTYNPADLSAPPALLLEAQVTNLVRNNTMVGAVAGAPGTLPNNWAKGTTAGWVSSVAGVGTENGINYIDINIAGTATVVGATAIYMEASNSAAAVLDDIMTTSMYISLVAGSLAGVQNFGIGFYEYDSGGIGAASGMVTPVTPTATLTRYSSTRAVVSATAAYYRPTWRCASTDTTTAVNFTVRIGLPQLEKSPFPSSVIKTTTSTQNRNADVSTSVAGVRPAGYIDNFQSYDYDSGVVPACPAAAAKLRGFTPAQAASAYAYGGGACARHWLPAQMQALGVAIDIGDPANLQGYIEAARLVVGEYWSPANNPDYGASMTVQDASKAYRTDGGDLLTDIGTRSRKMPLSLSAMPPADRTALLGILRANGTAWPMLVSLFPGSADLELDRDHTIYGKLSSVAAMALPTFDRYASTLEIEEV